MNPLRQHWRRGVTLLATAMVIALGVRVALDWHELVAMRDEQQEQMERVKSLRSQLAGLRREQAELEAASRSRVEALAAATARRANSQAEANAEIGRLLDHIQAVQAAMPAPPKRPKAPPSGPGGDVFSELMSAPGYAANVKALFHPGIEQRYAAFLRSHALPPETAAHLLDLLDQTVVAGFDAKDVALRAGYDPERDRQKIQDIRMKIDRQIRADIDALLGPSLAAEFHDYDRTVPQREVVAKFTLHLSYSDEPLSTEQESRLAAIMAGQQVVLHGGYSASAREFTDEVVAAAQNVLSPAQWEALKQFRREQTGR